MAESIRENISIKENKNNKDNSDNYANKYKNTVRDPKQNQRDKNNRNWDSNQRLKSKDVFKENQTRDKEPQPERISNTSKDKLKILSKAKTKDFIKDPVKETTKEEQANRLKERRQVSSFNLNYNNRNSEGETIDDIKEDIARIEKEIKLEIKEIKSLKLGL